MNEMKHSAIRRLSPLSGLLSLAIAACGAGEDITVGVRPTDGIAASVGNAEGGAGGLAMPGSDAMNQPLDGNDTTTRGVAGAGAPDASAGTIGTTPGSSGGAAAAPGAAGAGAGGAADAVDSSRVNEDECGAIPSRPAGNVASGLSSSSGLIGYDVEAPNVFTRLRTRLTVPAEPPPDGPIFVWTGVQPTANGMNLEPIGNGASMSVLAWGALCLPDVPESYSTWWIAPMYSNLSSTDPQYLGCHGGKITPAQPTQLLDIDIQLEGTTWVQRVVNRDTMEASEFSLNLKGQEQGRAFFTLELKTSNKPTEDLIFINTILSMDMSDPGACEPVMRGTNDFASRPRVSADGKHCCIDRIVLRAPRVMATTTDPP